MDDDRFEAYVKGWMARASHDLPAARSAATKYANATLLLLPVSLAACAAIALGAGAGSIVLLMSGGLLPLFLTVPLTMAAGVSVLEIWHSLVFRIPPPDGVPATRSALPALWARIDRVAAASGTKPPSFLVLERGCDAYAAWHAPHLFARSTSWLGLGLPLLVILEPEQLDSVIAHELAHLHHRDGAALRRTRRALVTWDALASRISYRCWTAAQPGAGAVERWTARLLRWTLAPLGRLIPQRLGAIERAVAREHELAADFAAARCTSPEAAASALVRLHALEPAWADLAMRAYDQALLAADAPSPRLPAENALLAAQPVDPWLARIHLASDLARDDHWTREHPALERRLVMLGIGIDRAGQRTISFDEAVAWAVQPPTGTVWRETFDGPAGNAVLQGVGEHWARGATADWTQARPKRIEQEARLQQLDERARSEQLVAREYLELARWSRGRGDRAAERNLLSWATHVDPLHGPAAMGLGANFLRAGDPTGVGWIEHAAAIGPEFGVDGAHLLGAFYRATGDHHNSHGWLDHRTTLEARLRGVGTTDTARINKALVTHEAPSEREQAILRWELRADADVQAAFVARLSIADAPLGRSPVAILVQLVAGTPEQRRAALEERLNDDLHAAWFASGYDQWFVMVTVGQCPAATLGGRIEAIAACRLHGIGAGGGVQQTAA